MTPSPPTSSHKLSVDPHSLDTAQFPGLAHRHSPMQPALLSLTSSFPFPSPPAHCPPAPQPDHSHPLPLGFCSLSEPTYLSCCGPPSRQQEYLSSNRPVLVGQMFTYQFLCFHCFTYERLGLPTGKQALGKRGRQMTSLYPREG